MRYNSCNEHVAAETYCNACVATKAKNCNSCDKAAAAETHYEGSVAAKPISCNSSNEAARVAMNMQLQKRTATVALQPKQ